MELLGGQSCSSLEGLSRGKIPFCRLPELQPVTLFHDGSLAEMKAQHRHELQTNELADKIGIYLKRMKPYSRQIILGAAALLIVVGVLLYMNNQRSARAGASWGDYFQAFGERDAKALAEVARLHAGSVAGLWAEQAAGDVLLATGAGQMFSDRDEAEKSLRDAEKHFKAVEQAAVQPMLRTRAQYGLAQVYESLADTDKACEYYEKVYRDDAESALGTAAKSRLDELSKDSMQRWYAWFERQEPPQPEPGAGGIEPNVPDDLGTLPSRPDLSFPGGLMPSSESPDEPVEPATTEPAAEEKPSAETSPDAPTATPPAKDAVDTEPSTEADAPAEPPAEPAVGEKQPSEPPAESKANEQDSADAPEPAGAKESAEPPSADETPAPENPAGAESAGSDSAESNLSP